MDIKGLKAMVESVNQSTFDAVALEVFRYQSQHCEVYRLFLSYMQTDVAKVNKLADIPYLPIEFFKGFEIKTYNFQSELVFESSSTTGIGVSKHFLDTSERYEEAFTRSFNHALGKAEDYCHLALLPSYLERQNSSLVYQVNHFIQNSNYSDSAFYLDQIEQLHKQLQKNEANAVPTILWGVTYALLDLAEQFQIPLKHTRIIETGGMKGRRKEITRVELHETLMKAFGVQEVSGEYGMTELLSQAYSLSDGKYICPPQMRVSIREINDPLSAPLTHRHGAVNVCDLYNLQSCAFVATSDLGKAHDDGSFEILGRIDYSDTRGCNLLVV